MYRDDYARGGIRMLPVIDRGGDFTARRIMVCSILLIPASLSPFFLGMTGGWYAAAAIAGGIGMLYFGARMGQERTIQSANALLLATVFYLPALLGVMVLDRTPSFSLASSNVSITAAASSYRGIVDGRQ